ncbi:MAG: DUF4405 domain-containing protein [Archaeoglobaceae archaeon]
MQAKLRVILFTISMIFGTLSLVTGVVLYFWPKPRAGWYEFLGLSKANWSDLHTHVSLIALVAILVHLIVNRRSIKLYVDCLRRI